MSRILIIDDSELITNLVKEFLSAQGFDVRAAADANQGFTAAKEFHPDLILLDVQLPDVQGFDLIRIIKNRAELQHIPIIMITGTHHQTDHKVKALQAGADDYVLKPFELPELTERIRAVLRRSERQAAPVREAAHESALKGSQAEISEQKKELSLKETMLQILAAPETLHVKELPPVTLLYLFALLGLSLGGLALSSGSTVKPALIAIGMPGFWGICVAVLVMSCSVLGVSLTWKEGSRLISVAGLPLLLKLLGGFVMMLATSLSPLSFSASPDIFFRSSSALLERLDIFEIWTIWLIWTMTRSLKGGTRQKAAITALGVWLVVAYWQSLWNH